MPLLYRTYDILLNLLLLFFSPFFLVYSLVTGKYRQGLCQRLGLYPASVKKSLRASPQRLWIHAVSVGEVRVAAALIASLKELYPSEFLFVLSTVTEQGQAVAKETLADQAVCIFFPIDVSWAVRKALRLIAPKAVVCLETELWPGFIYHVHKSNSKLVLVNGRISVRSFDNYMKIRWFMKPFLSRFECFSMIGKDDAERIAAFGADIEKVTVQGNAKYDLLSQQARPEIEETLRERLGIGPDHPVLIAGSTHPGEEEFIIDAYQFLRKTHNSMVLILAPRHLERVPEVESLLQKNDLPYQKWSTFESLRSGYTIILDRMGCLFDFYSIGSIVFCGGSLVPYGGHNILEPAAWGKVVFYGPHMSDFQDAKLLLESVMAGVEIKDTREFVERSLWFLRHPDELQACGLQAKMSVESNRGASRRQALLIKKVLTKENRKAA